MNTHAHLVNAHHMDGTMARSGGGGRAKCRVSSSGHDAPATRLDVRRLPKFASVDGILISN